MTSVTEAHFPLKESVSVRAGAGDIELKEFARKPEAKKNSPADPPGRGGPGASPRARPRERQRLPRDRAAAGGQLGTPGGGRGSEPGATATAAPPPRSATSASAMQPADVDGWS